MTREEVKKRLPAGHLVELLGRGRNLAELLGQGRNLAELLGHGRHLAEVVTPPAIAEGVVLVPAGRAILR